MKWLLILLCSTALCAKEPHPVKKVQEWFADEKERSEGRFITLASLATVDGEGNPHARIIEITRFTQRDGAYFFTHENTEKVSHLTVNPHASLNFYLPKTHRQICIDGTVETASQEEAEKAWSRTPRFMKLTFLASQKGEPLESVETLEIRKKEIAEQYPKEIPYPTSFRGYRLKPSRIIFFQMNKRTFPTKEVALLKQEDWVCTLVQP